MSSHENNIDAIAKTVVFYSNNVSISVTVSINIVVLITGYKATWLWFSICTSHRTIGPDLVAQSVEHRPQVQEAMASLLMLKQI